MFSMASISKQFGSKSDFGLPSSWSMRIAQPLWHLEHYRVVDSNSIDRLHWFCSFDRFECNRFHICVLFDIWIEWFHLNLYWPMPDHRLCWCFVVLSCLWYEHIDSGEMHKRNKWFSNRHKNKTHQNYLQNLEFLRLDYQMGGLGRCDQTSMAFMHNLLNFVRNYNKYIQITFLVTTMNNVHWT